MFRHGPQAAAGVVVWAHGYGGPGQDYRNVPLPGLLAVLNDAGWDVLRHDRDPAADELHLALPALLRGLPALREAGYRRVMLGGQSRGGWQAMLAAAQRPELVDAVLATAPAAHGEASRPHPDALPDFSRAIAALPPDRVRLLVALFEEDPFDPSPTAREAAVQAAAAARMAPTLAIRPRAEVARGHNGAQDWRFTRLFAGCLLTWLDGAARGHPARRAAGGLRRRVGLSARRGGSRVRAQLPRAVEHLVLQLGRGARRDGDVHPGAVTDLLPEQHDANAVRAELPAEDVGRGAEALPLHAGGRVPVRDDDAAEGIGRGKRHEGKGVERRAPQEGVHPEPGAALVGLAALARAVGAEDQDAVLPAKAPADRRAAAVVSVLVGAGRPQVGAAAGGEARARRDAEEEARQGTLRSPGHASRFRRE
jgi:pimeloyl-ACP methyl ester carboxylesterase